MPQLSELHPMLRGLFEVLPPAGSVWPAEQRARWLEVVQYVFPLLYEEPKHPAPEAPRQGGQESG